MDSVLPHPFKKRKKMTNEEKWMEHYSLLKKYVSEHGHLPDKKKVENRGLLNWWKYNKKRAKQGLLPPDRLALLKTLSDMRLTGSMTSLATCHRLSMTNNVGFGGIKKFCRFGEIKKFCRFCVKEILSV